MQFNEMFLLLFFFALKLCKTESNTREEKKTKCKLSQNEEKNQTQTDVCLKEKKTTTI